MSVRFLVGASMALAACYDAPTPACGFACQATDECPEGYTCGADDRCHATGFENEACEVPSGVEPVSTAPSVIFNSIEGRPIDPTLTFFELQLSEPVRGLDRDTVRFMRDDGVGVTPVSMFAEGFSVLFDFPMHTLQAQRSYTLELRGNIFDSEGYRLVPYRYTFPVIVDPAPFIDQRFPTGVNVPVNIGVITLQPSEEIFGFGASDIVLQKNGVVVPMSLVIDTPTYIEFAIPQQLEQNAVYTVELRAGAADLGGQLLPAESWQFTTGADTVRPSATTPTLVASKVPVDAPIRVVFDEPVIGVSSSSIVLEYMGAPVAASVTYNAAQRVATLVPERQLQGEQPYRLHVTSAIGDAHGNALLPITRDFFTQFDDAPPKITSTSPAAASTGASTTSAISMTFDEPVHVEMEFPDPDDVTVTADFVAQPGTLTRGARTWTFTPSQPLPPGATIRVRVGVYDLFFNYRQYAYSFMTGPT